MSHAEKIESGYRDRGGLFAAIVIVRVDKAHYTNPLFGEGRPWLATATVLKIVSGKVVKERITFDEGSGNSCSTRPLTRPLAGEKWALYFRKRADGVMLVYQTYPLDIALKADPRLREKYRP